MIKVNKNDNQINMVLVRAMVSGWGRTQEE